MAREGIEPPTRGFSGRRMLIHQNHREPLELAQQQVRRPPSLFRSIRILTCPRSSGTPQVLESTYNMRGAMLLSRADDYRHQLPLPLPVVEVNRHHLLPRPEHQFPVHHWHRQTRLE